MKLKITFMFFLGAFLSVPAVGADSMQEVVRHLSKSVKPTACEEKLGMNSARMGKSLVVQFPDGSLRIYGENKNIFTLQSGRGCEAKKESDLVKIGSNQRIGDSSHYLDSVVSAKIKSITASEAAELYKGCDSELSISARDELAKKMGALDFLELSKLGLSCGDSPYSKDCELKTRDATRDQKNLLLMGLLSGLPPLPLSLVVDGRGTSCGPLEDICRHT